MVFSTKNLLVLAFIALFVGASAQRPCNTNCDCPDIRAACVAIRDSPLDTCQKISGNFDGNVQLTNGGCVIIEAASVMSGSIRGVSGDNCVFIEQFAIVTGSINLKDGIDYVFMGEDTTVTGSLSFGSSADCLETQKGAKTGPINMGSENDVIFSVGVTVRANNGRPTNVVLGGGNDCMLVTGEAKKRQVRETSTMRDIYAGAGNDDVNFADGSFQNIYGYAGDDCISVGNVQFRTIQGQYGRDQIFADRFSSTLPPSDQSTYHIDGGNDGDFITVSEFQGGFGEVGRINGGGGTDTCCGEVGGLFALIRCESSNGC